MLSYLATYVEVPGFLDLAKKALKNKSKTQYIRVADSLQVYFKAVEKQPSEEIVEVILKRCDKAKTKSELMAGLQFLVETQIISEFGALSRLEDWKEENESW